MTDAFALHDQIVAARQDHHRAEHRLATLLARFADARLFADVGYATIHDYAREVLDLDVRKTRALVQLGRAMGALPALDRAFADGHIGWTKARELLRVATPDTVDAWVDRARDVSSRVLEHQVGQALIGEGPPDASEVPRLPARQRLVFDVDAADAQVIRDALALLRSQTGDADDGVLLAAIAERVVREAPASEAPTGESYRKVLVQCPRCRATTGGHHEVTDTVVDEAECDHEAVIGDPGPDLGRLSHAIPPTRRRAVLARDRHRCAAPGCTCRLWLHVHHVRFRSRGGDHAVENLVTVCTVHHRLIHAGRMGVLRDSDGSLLWTMPPRRGPRGSARQSSSATIAPVAPATSGMPGPNGDTRTRTSTA